MRPLILSVFPFVAILTAFSLPLNTTVLQLPSSPTSLSQLNATIVSFGDWPDTPYTVDIGDTSVTLRQYGRYANPEFRVEVVQAMNQFRRYFYSKWGLLTNSPIVLISSIVKLQLEFGGIVSRLRGEDVYFALLPFQLYYSDTEWSLREITSADIGILPPRRRSVATFKITFQPI